MKGIEAEFGVGKLAPRARLKGPGHVHGDEPNGLRQPLMSNEVILERGKGIGLATFHGAEGTDFQRVMKDRQIAQATTDKFLISAQGFDVGISGLGTGGFDVNIDRIARCGSPTPRTSEQWPTPATSWPRSGPGHPSAA